MFWQVTSLSLFLSLSLCKRVEMSYGSGKLKSGIKSGVSRLEDIIFLRQYQPRCERVSIIIFYNHGDNKEFPSKIHGPPRRFSNFFFFLLRHLLLFSPYRTYSKRLHTTNGNHTRAHTHIHTHTHTHTRTLDYSTPVYSKIILSSKRPSVSNLLYVISLIFFFSYTHLSVQSKSL